MSFTAGGGGSPNVVCMGEGVTPKGAPLRVQRVKLVGALREAHRSERPLSPEALEIHLDSMRRRDVRLEFDGAAFFLWWQERDTLAWRDAERVLVNFDALLERFGLTLRRSADGLSPGSPIHKLPLVFLDTETTGLSPKLGDRICEVALCRVEPGITGEWIVSLVDPERELGDDAARINGITRAMLEGQPLFSDLVPRLLPVLAGAVVIAHNASFDVRFLVAEFERAGVEWQPAAVLDTKRLAKRIFPGPSHRLQDLAQALRIEVKEAHRAKADVATLIGLWQKLLEKRPGATLGELQRL